MQKWPGKSPAIVKSRSLVRAVRSVPDRDAGDVGAFQRPAYGFRLIAVEPGETGAVQLLVALGDHRLGERIGLAEQAAGLLAGGVEALAGFALGLQRADLDDPAGMGGNRLDGAVLLNG